MPVPKVPAYGDAARLTQLASGLKREHGTYGAVVQRNPVGRPSGQTQAAQPSPSAPALPQQHLDSAKTLARAEWARNFWNGMVQRYPDDPLIEMYAANANRIADAHANDFYANTPNYEY